METGSRIKSVCVIVGGLGLGLFIASGGQAQVIHPDQMISIPPPSQSSSLTHGRGMSGNYET